MVQKDKKPCIIETVPLGLESSGGSKRKRGYKDSSALLHVGIIGPWMQRPIDSRPQVLKNTGSADRRAGLLKLNPWGN